MALPAQLRNQLGGLLDSVYDAMQAGVPYQETIRVDFGGRTVKLRVIFDPSRPEMIQALIFWKPLPGI